MRIVCDSNITYGTNRAEEQSTKVTEGRDCVLSSYFLGYVIISTTHLYIILLKDDF